jgi:transcriptional antiterminator NusG
MTEENNEIVEHLSDMELGQEGIESQVDMPSKKEDVEFKDVKDTKAPQKKWYIVHTYSGHENKVKVNLEKRIEYMNMGDKIFRIEVPQKTVTKMKDGKKTDREEKIFPGYVLVEMIMDDDSWYVVRHTAGVTKFVGSSKKPIPAKDSEIKRIIHKTQNQVSKVELDVKAGDKVRIISGPFSEFIGDITEVYPDKSKLRAMVSIFGRETPVELEYKQIQKI